MNYVYEWIETEELLPIKIIVHTAEEAVFIPSHWHESIEISYVQSGKIDEVYIDGKTCTSNQGDIILINSNAIHSFSVDRGKDRRALTVFIPPEFLKEKGIEIDEIAFDCISFLKTISKGDCNLMSCG